MKNWLGVLPAEQANKLSSAANSWLSGMKTARLSLISVRLSRYLSKQLLILIKF